MTRKSPRAIESRRGIAGLALAVALAASLLPLSSVLAVAPAAPSTPNLAAASDTGNSNTDNITKTLNGLIFTGNAEAAATVKIYVAGTTVIGTAVASGGGAYSVTTTVALPDNTANLITATATNGDGEGTPSGALTVTTDNLTPAAPSAPNLDAASDTGTSNSDNYTSDTTPTFSGTSEDNATVQLYAGATLVGTGQASGAGTWNITSSTLSVGVYSFTAVQTDAAGNGPSGASGTLSVTIDTTVPAAPSAPDLQTASDTGTSSTDNITADTTPTFTGTTADPSTVVDLYAGSTLVGSGTSDGSGNWTITSSVLSQGTYSVTAKATNLAGTSPASAALSVGIYTSLAVTVNQAAAQVDPTATSPIDFTVVFTHPVTNFTNADVTFAGTAGGTKAASVSGSGTTYNVAVTGMTTAGTVIVSLLAGVASDAAANANLASTSSDATVTWAPGSPSVTINQAVTQADPTATSPINFTVLFSASVTGFTSADVTTSASTAGGTKVVTVTGSGTSYNVAVSGMTTAGTVIATIPAGVATATSGGQANLVSTSTDNTVNWAPGAPTVTINQAVGQADPTAVSPINFTVVFNGAVTGFTSADVTTSASTAGGTKVVTVTGSGTTYTVAVTGMTTAGTVIATIPAGVATAISDGQANLASTSTDNTVNWAPVVATITLTTSAPVITWGSGIVLTTQFGINGAGKTFQLQGTRDGFTWATIATLTTDAFARSTFAYRPVTNNWYRVVFAGAADLSGATSASVRTVVRQIALLRPKNSGAIRSIARNTSITFTTTVRPARPELAPAKVSFSFYRMVSGSWRLIAKRDVYIDAFGLARTTFKFTSTGQWYVRAAANPTPYNANSMPSPRERYNVY